MMNDMVRILNIDIQNVRCDDLLRNLKRGVLVTPNVDHLVQLQCDMEFYECYRRAEWCVCDSQVLFFLSHLLRVPLRESVSGADFFTKYYLYHRNDPNCRIFLLGAREGVADLAMRKINERVGREIVVGAHSPSYGFEKKPDEIESIIDIVNNSGANVVLVGVGAPKQEKFIMTYKDRMPGVDVWLALGATIDFESGTLSRAPKWISKIGMEWLYRITQDPKRMFKRYFGDDLIFFWYFLKQLCGWYKDPFEGQRI